tara:strand:+ start:21200 stop:21583 length:384 start_codon:yes stop_codon:yes gene_type:complete
MDMLTNKELVIEFAKAWNNLDSSFISELMDEDFHYASQWVMNEIDNKSEYLKYLDNKFSAIAKSEGSLVAELGMSGRNYCLVLSQVQRGSTSKVTFLITTKNGKLVRADTCKIPTPESIKLLNVVPR